MEVSAGQLEGMEDADDAFHAGQDLEDLGVDGAFVADHPDDRPLGPAGHVALEAERFDPADHRGQLLFGGVRLHDDDHGRFLPLRGGGDVEAHGRVRW